MFILIQNSNTYLQINNTLIINRLQSCPASSAAIERWFSTIGFIWNKVRNRLGDERAMKLAQVYRALRVDTDDTDD